MPTDAILNALNPHSFEALARNQTISDNKYVYAKTSGTVTSENGLGHTFTATSTNLRTVTNLREEIRTKFGETALEATSSLLEEFQSGKTQLKVKDLRTIFTLAESVKLNEVARELTATFGTDMGNAFVTTMGDAIANRGLISSDDICALLSAKYGINTANFAMERYGLDHFSGEMLKTLPAHLAEIKEHFSDVSLTENGSRALRDFFASPTKNADDLIASVTKNFQEKEFINFVKARAPKNPTINDCIKLILLTDKRYKGQICYKFGEELGITKNYEQLGMGIDQLAADGVILTEDIKNGLREKLTIFKEAMKSLQEFSNKFLSEHLVNGAPSSFLAETANDLCKQVISAGNLDVDAKRFTAASIHELLEVPLESFYARLTDMNEQIAYEIDQHPQWSPADQAAFREAMLFCHSPSRSPFPDHRPLPTLDRNSGTPTEHIVSALKSHLYQQLDSPELKAMFLKLSGLFGGLEGQFLAHIRELSQLPEEKQTPQYMAKIVFENENLDITERMQSENINNPREYYYMMGIMRSEYALDILFKINPKFKAEFEEKVASNMKDYGISRKDAITNVASMGQIAALLINFQSLILTGIKPDVAANLIFAEPPKTLTLDAFALGSDQIEAIRTRAEAIKQFNVDFHRAGNSSVTVHTSDGSTVVRNDTSGLSEEERIGYDAGKGSSFTQTLFNTLDRLCAGNEAQFLTALTALTQAGPVGYQKTLAPLINGKGHPKLEHAPLDFTLSKDGNGIIHLHAESPKDEQSVYLSVDIEIDQAGVGRLTSFRQSTVAP